MNESLRDLRDQGLVELAINWRSYAEMYKSGSGPLAEMDDLLLAGGYIATWGPGWFITDRSGRRQTIVGRFLGSKDVVFTRERDVHELTRALDSGSYGYGEVKEPLKENE